MCTFVVTDEHGEIHAQTGQGLFAIDTRADFTDLFEGKSKRLLQRGRMRTTWNESRETQRNVPSKHT